MYSSNDLIVNVMAMLTIKKIKTKIAFRTYVKQNTQKPRIRFLGSQGIIDNLYYPQLSTKSAAVLQTLLEISEHTTKSFRSWFYLRQFS